jgi:hypothetical protein
VHEQRPTTHERRLTGNQRSLLGLSVLSTYGSGMIVTSDVTQPGVVVLTVSAISDQGSLGGKLAADLTRPPPTPLDNRIIRQAADSYDRVARTPMAGCPPHPSRLRVTIDVGATFPRPPRRPLDTRRRPRLPATRPHRPGRSPADTPAVLAAVHDATDAIIRVGAHDRRAIRAAALP